MTPLMVQEPRYMAVQACVDVNELIQSRPGGVVRCTNPGAIFVIQSGREWFEPIADEV